METLEVGRAKLTWLNGGVTFLDGGAMFGVVPKPLWSKKYPVNEKNQIELRTDPLLLQIDKQNFLIDSGVGVHKFTDKQIRNFGILEQSKVEQSLQELGLTTHDVDGVLMTHLHFDHACGLTKWQGENLVPSFENATIFVTDVEWNEMRNPNLRSQNTYWEANWKPIEKKVEPFSKEVEIVPGLKMIHTSGHSDGHAIIVFEDKEEVFIHMADIMPTHAHQNPLWVLAYDDYPVTSVHQKEKWTKAGFEKQAWYTFYHDAYYRALKYNTKGEIVDEISRQRYQYTD
ncbi:Glyoxylase, beta-lactamase superfamily II [Salinibacillus kushneri]|uniref:Glyoxylase, beta-lactamase superfamily II n=1 Tax=Salinibacillus kushneri TaxID=237682 RepID=A0A1I0JF68_9BACI|nr:MBL fold metallo-hydrolase [Salinibacillus kushneri]SEU07916.1 Glyoxylase, beta-lactamase superfamily II [Salinibacillus kushneri]